MSECSLAYAVQQLNIWKREVAENRYQKKQPRPKAILTVADVWERYLKGYELAGKKAAWRQRMAWKHLKGTFEKMRPEQVTTASLIDYQQARKAEGASNATVNRELSALSAAIVYGAKMTVEGGKPLLERVPIFPTKLKESAPRSGFITDVQYATLAANCNPLWLRAFLACAYTFGFRRGELLNLQVRQVDFFDRWIILEAGTTKNGDSRKAYMTGDLFELMKACCSGKKPDAHVFTREDGSSVTDLREDWQSACAAAGLGKYVPARNASGEDYQKYVGLTPHDLRRSAVRRMVRSNIPQSVAMRISGHKTAAVFRRYDICDESDLQDATRKLESGRQAQTQTDTETSTSTPEPSSQASQLPRM